MTREISSGIVNKEAIKADPSPEIGQAGPQSIDQTDLERPAKVLTVRADISRMIENLLYDLNLNYNDNVKDLLQSKGTLDLVEKHLKL